MFEGLSDKILGAIRRVRGQGRLTEAQISEAIKEIRLGLLEADVGYRVVKKFVDSVTQKALGAEVVQSVTAGQQLVKIVHDELVELLGSEHRGLEISGHGPHVIMLVGLQGAGKTTTAAKLAAHVKKLGRRPFLVPVDVYRPAAIEQLKVLASENSFPVFQTQPNMDPRKIVTGALGEASAAGCDIVILDTAGRLQIDELLMKELSDIKQLVQPKEILLVADGMTGQEAVNVSQGFHEKLGLTGVILTKLDGDTRGGAALSIKMTIGQPIKFMGVSEKISGLEPFHPERIASRILDMGDVLTLVERASEVVEAEKAKELQKKMARNQFTLEDFLDQLKQIKKMGPLEGILKMLPGMGQLSKELKNLSPPDEELKKIEAMINSMTPQERRNYKILNGSRRTRIAGGSGTQVSDLNRFIKKFEQTQKMMQMFSKMGKGRGGLPF
ncbi:MAG: signal recognition particle protein [Oligoflexia bacterium]|nr:signal recognition particle protein [Oligoflexia bacterium]